jgi:hypothetical protein
VDDVCAHDVERAVVMANGGGVETPCCNEVALLFSVN